jgi:hypothetical protein
MERNFKAVIHDWRERPLCLSGKTLREFQPGDPLFAKFGTKERPIHCYCKFVGIERGCVVAEVVSVEQEHQQWTPRQIRVRAAKCYLWGQGKDDSWPRCHWFKTLEQRAL